MREKSQITVNIEYTPTYYDHTYTQLTFQVWPRTLLQWLFAFCLNIQVVVYMMNISGITIAKCMFDIKYSRDIFVFSKPSDNIDTNSVWISRSTHGQFLNAKNSNFNTFNLKVVVCAHIGQPFCMYSYIYNIYVIIWRKQRNW